MSVECKNIKKSFGAVKALTDINISVGDGEIRALLGGNGSGKSTLAKILGGVIAPDSGSIMINDSVYNVSSPMEAKKRGVVITSQELSLFDNLSVYENLCLCSLPCKKPLAYIDKKAMVKKVNSILAELGLEKLKEKRILDLSSNELYLIEFIKALMQQPKVLVVDEVTSALFSEDVEIVRKAIHQLKQANQTILFVSHRMQEVYSVCDSVTIMKNGETVGTYPTYAKKQVELISLMTGRDVSELVPHAAIHKDARKDSLGLDIKNMHIKKFGTKINLGIKKGEIIGIAGLEGQGQSDFIKSLFGLCSPIRIKYLGENIVINNPFQAVRKKIAYISGNRELEGTFQQRSIGENIRVVSDLILAQKINDVDVFLEKCGVKYSSSMDLITSLSGGNQQKVIIGRWLAIGPKLFLADDPTKGIDVSARQDVHKMLYEIARKGSMVIMSSSDEEEIVELTSNAESSRVLVMYEGQIKSILSKENISLENIASAALKGEEV